LVEQLIEAGATHLDVPLFMSISMLSRLENLVLKVIFDN